jgi:hypothetical protein
MTKAEISRMDEWYLPMDDFTITPERSAGPISDCDDNGTKY